MTNFLVPWDKIKAEYISGKWTRQKIADKYGLTVKAVCYRARKDKWMKQRMEVRENVKHLVADKLSENLLQHMARVAEKAGEMMSHIDGIEIRLPKKCTSIRMFIQLANAYEKMDFIRRRALGAEDHAKSGEEGMTPTNLARQAEMLEMIKNLSILNAEGKTLDLVPDLEKMKKATIVDDGS